jgi:hypothetical protein
VGNRRNTDKLLQEQSQRASRLKSRIDAFERDANHALANARVDIVLAKYEDKVPAQFPDDRQGLEVLGEKLATTEQSFFNDLADAIGHSRESSYWETELWRKLLKRPGKQRVERARFLRQKFTNARFDTLLAKYASIVSEQLPEERETLAQLSATLEQRFAEELAGVLRYRRQRARWTNLFWSYGLSVYTLSQDRVERARQLRNKILAVQRAATETLGNDGRKRPARSTRPETEPRSTSPAAKQVPLTNIAQGATASNIRIKKEFVIEAHQLRSLLGGPNYRVLPADLWTQIGQAAGATLRVDAPEEVLFLPPLDRPDLRVITNGSMALRGGKLMALEAEKALIVRNGIQVEECVAGFVYAGACSLGTLTVDGPGRVNIEYLKASQDNAQTLMPHIDVQTGYILCRKVEWPYPTIKCVQLTYVEWPIGYPGAFRHGQTTLSDYEGRKQRMIKEITAITKVSVPRVLATMAPPRKPSASVRSHKH